MAMGTVNNFLKMKKYHLVFSLVTIANDLDTHLYPSAAYLDDLNSCMRDADGDGYGDATDPNIPMGTDCDDNDATLTPIDADGDGFSTCDGDCNDTSIHTFRGSADRNRQLLARRMKMVMAMGPQHQYLVQLLEKIVMIAMNIHLVEQQN